MAYLQLRPRYFGENGAQPRPLSSATIEGHYRRLKRFWNWLVERGHVASNPLNPIPRPKIEERVIPTVSERQSRDLLRYTDPKLARNAAERFRAYRNRAVLALLLDTPGRRNEICCLNVEDVDFEAGKIRVMGKGSRGREMLVGATTLEYLWDYIQMRAALRPRCHDLWVDECGQPMKPNWLYLMLRRLGQRAGVPRLHPHRFRHTYAVKMLKNRMPERILAMVGGWKKIPETYFRTLGVEDARPYYDHLSPFDQLAQQSNDRARRRRRSSRSRL